MWAVLKANGEIKAYHTAKGAFGGLMREAKADTQRRVKVGEITQDEADDSLDRLDSLYRSSPSTLERLGSSVHFRTMWAKRTY